MSPKQRIPYLYTNNSAQAEAVRRRQQRVSNMERAEVPTTNITNTYELKIPRKPINPMIPVAGPVSNTFIPLMYYVSYEGYLYSFDTTALTSLETLSPVDIRRCRSLKVYRNNTFYWVGEDLGSSFDLQFFRSEDGINVVAGGVPTASAELVHFDVASDGRIWAFWSRWLIGEQSGMYYSDDGGDNWVLSQAFPDDGTVELNAVACHASNPDWIATTALDDTAATVRLWVTQDRGVTWNSTLLTGSAGFSGVVDPGYQVHFAGDEIVWQFISSDNGRSLYGGKSTINLEVTQNLLLDGSESPGGLVWWYGSVVDPDDPDVVIFVHVDDFGDPYISRSVDKGISFIPYAFPFVNDTGGPWGMIIYSGDLYLFANELADSVSVYKIADIRTASMTPVFVLTVSSANAVAEASRDNITLSRG